MVAICSPTEVPMTNSAASESNVSAQKQGLLIAFYQAAWNEMSWRRNAGYRTIILGLGYFAVLLTVVAMQPNMADSIRIAIGSVMLIGTLFGGGYLASNYRKYMAAAKQTVMIEEYLGAYDPQFLGSLGPLMTAERKRRPEVPLSGDPVSLLSVIAFTAGGIITAIAILAM